MAVEARNVMGLESAIDKHHRHGSSCMGIPKLTELKLDRMFGDFRSACECMLLHV